MQQLIILGSSNAIPDEHHENTHMVLVGKERTILIDCVGHPISRLTQAGVDFHSLTDMILTHFHPDHVSGVALLLMNLWLMGRKTPLNIYGLEHTLERTEKMMGFFDWETWPDFFPVIFHRLPEVEMALVLESEEVRVYASPVKHIIPTIGLRFESLETNQSVAYSCDTEPCPQVVRLADGCKVLIHEAAGATYGHSSATQAGQIARMAEAGQLYLIHYPTHSSGIERLVIEAREQYGGPVALARDFTRVEF